MPAIWARVELMGHNIHYGRLTEREFAGGKLGVCEIPTSDGGFREVLFSSASIFRITPCDEAVARHNACSPIMPYEQPPAALPAAVEVIDPSYRPRTGDVGDFLDDAEEDERADLLTSLAGVQVTDDVEARADDPRR